MGSLSASGLKIAQDRQRAARPRLPPRLPAHLLSLSRSASNYAECGITCATLIDDVIEMEDPATVAAIIVEPIGHTGGIIDPPRGILADLARNLRSAQHPVDLRRDHHRRGPDRTTCSPRETFGVTPDVLCIGKGLSGGYAPLSAMMCRRPIADAFWGPIAENPGFVEGHTFEGNPISCAAGMAVLQEILERDLCGNARVQGQRLRAGLEAAGQETRRHRRHSRQGTLSGNRVRPRSHNQAAIHLRTGLRRPRRPAGAGQRHVDAASIRTGWRFGPPLISTAEQIDEMVAILDRSIGEARASLPLEAMNHG